MSLNPKVEKAREWLCGFTRLSEESIADLVEELCEEIDSLQKELQRPRKNGSQAIRGGIK